MPDKSTTVGELLVGTSDYNELPQSVLDINLGDAKIIIELYNKYKPQPGDPTPSNPYWIDSESRRVIEAGQAYWSEEGGQ